MIANLPLNGHGVPCVLDAETTARLVADGKITEDDAYAVERFREFLAYAGSAPPRQRQGESATEYAARRAAWRAALTPEQKEWWRAALADAEWREFLGLPAIEAAAP